jgi:hypothetical protein
MMQLQSNPKLMPRPNWSNKIKKYAKRLTLSITASVLLASLLLPSAFAADMPAGTVVSNRLKWTQNNSTVVSPGKSNWSVAKNTCDKLTAGGYTDWRLPLNSELNALDKGLLKSAGWTIDYIWSSETDHNSNYHYVKWLGNVDLLETVPNNNVVYVSCVRRAF